MILFVDVKGISGKRLSLGQGGGRVIDPAVGEIGKVTHTEWRGDDVRVSVEIGDEKLADYLARMKNASVF